MSKLESVGFKDFTRYLASLPDHGKGCAVCGESSYRIGSTFTTEVSGKPTIMSQALPYAGLKGSGDDKMGELMLNNALPVLTRECMICGHIVFFSHQTVLNKINESRPEKGEDGE